MSGLLRNSLMVALLILLWGCYSAEHEVIPPAMGVSIPYAHSEIIFDEGGTADLTPDPDNNDFRFRTVSEDGSEIDTGTFRALHIRDEIYVLQVKYDEEVDFYLVFYKILPDRIEPLEPEDYAAVEILAKKYNVSVNFDYANYIDGNPGDIIAFLRSHDQFSFRPRETF